MTRCMWSSVPAGPTTPTHVHGSTSPAALAGYEHIFPDRAPKPTMADSRTQWQQWLRAEGSVAQRVLVALEGDEVVGTALVGSDGTEPTRGRLARLYVRPDRWGHGVGRLLHDTALEQLRAGGFGDATLWVLEHNQRAREWYERLGWQATGERKAVYAPARIDDLHYRVDLARAVGSEHRAADEAFERIHAAGRRAVLDGTHATEVPPTRSGRWGPSVVLRPSGGLAQVMDALTGELVALAGTGHWRSGITGRAHLTVRSLEPFTPNLSFRIGSTGTDRPCIGPLIVSAPCVSASTVSSSHPMVSWCAPGASTGAPMRSGSGLQES